LKHEIFNEMYGNIGRIYTKTVAIGSIITLIDSMATAIQ